MIFKKGHYKSRLDEKMGNWTNYLSIYGKEKLDNQTDWHIIKTIIVSNKKIYFQPDTSLIIRTLRGKDVI